MSKNLKEPFAEFILSSVIKLTNEDMIETYKGQRFSREEREVCFKEHMEAVLLLTLEKLETRITKLEKNK